MSRELTRNWLRHMRSGNFEAAWQISDEIMRMRRRLASPRCVHLGREALWNGESLHGQRVLIRCCHGLGDTLQVIRYAALVRRQAKHVVVQAQASVSELLQRVDGIDVIRTLYDDVPTCSYDVAIESMELPHVFRATLSSVPAEVPYVRVRPRPQPTGGSLAIGTVWRAGEWDKRRSIPSGLIAPLASIPGVTLHALQHRARREAEPWKFGIDSSSDDLLEAARVIAGLDLMISVDSMPAHLAGALGTPTWLLLHAHSDWRWMTDRSDSPWYPTMRVFRQERARDWGAVIEKIADELAQLASSRSRIARENYPPIAA